MNSRILAFIPQIALLFTLTPGVWYLARALVFFVRIVHADWQAHFDMAHTGSPSDHCDFTMFWTAGVAQLHEFSGPIYNFPVFVNLANRMTGQQALDVPFIYPPTILPALAVIGRLPLVPAYYLFTVSSLAVSILLLARSGVSYRYILTGLLSPAAIWTFYLGQISLLIGALLIFGLSRLETRPRFAGMVLSLLAIKPTMALIIPITVFARRNWQAVAAGIMGCLILVGLSWLFAGVEAWAAYLGMGRYYMRQLLEAPYTIGAAHTPQTDYLYYGTSILWMMRSLHAGLPLAYAVQLAVSLAGLCLGWLVWCRNNMQMLDRLAMTTFLMPLLTPYGLTSDLDLMSLMLAVLARRAKPWRNVVLGTLWSAPAITPYIAREYGVLLTPLVPLVALALSLTQQKKPLLAEQIGELA